MTLLTREAILAAQDLPIEDVEVPEWGGTVRVRGLTGTERDAIESLFVDDEGRSIEIKANYINFRARLVAMSIIGDDGQRLFSEQDIETLGRKSAIALTRVFEVAQRLSGLAASSIEELRKNLKGDQSDDSTSG